MCGQSFLTVLTSDKVLFSENHKQLCILKKLPNVYECQMSSNVHQMFSNHKQLYSVPAVIFLDSINYLMAVLLSLFIRIQRVFFIKCFASKSQDHVTKIILLYNRKNKLSNILLLVTSSNLRFPFKKKSQVLLKLQENLYINSDVQVNKLLRYQISLHC